MIKDVSINMLAIYVTIFDRTDEQKRLIALLEEWGFTCYGKKNSSSGEELVYVRTFTPDYDAENPLGPAETG